MRIYADHRIEDCDRNLCSIPDADHPIDATTSAPKQLPLITRLSDSKEARRAWEELTAHA